MWVRGRGGVLLAWGRGRRRDASPALSSKGLWAGIVVAWSFGGRWWGFWCSCVEDVRPRRLAKGAVVGGGIYGVCGVGSGEMVDTHRARTIRFRRSGNENQQEEPNFVL